MLRTRLWMGALLVAVVVAIFWIDAALGQFPFLFLLLILLLAWAACLEMLHLIASIGRPIPLLCYVGITLVILANLPAHLPVRFTGPAADSWAWVAWTFTSVVLAAFLLETATFREPGQSVQRIALTIWIVVYLGLLPSFLVQTRWPIAANGTDLARIGTLSLALAVFIPKCCDIGAYFTGRFLGRHRMTPVLSPKKTWEGAIGGLLTAVGATIGINRLGPALPDIASEVGFGLTVGLAGMLGDLAESLIKRDCRQKDASQVVPGFGGVLDIVDAILFAAPVAYGWLR